MAGECQRLSRDGYERAEEGKGRLRRPSIAQLGNRSLAGIGIVGERRARSGRNEHRLGPEGKVVLDGPCTEEESGDGQHHHRTDPGTMTADPGGLRTSGIA